MEMLFFDTIANERLVQQNGRRHGIFSTKLELLELFYLALNMERIQPKRTSINQLITPRYVQTSWDIIPLIKNTLLWKWKRRYGSATSQNLIKLKLPKSRTIKTFFPNFGYTSRFSDVNKRRPIDRIVNRVCFWNTMRHCHYYIEV